MRHRVMLLAVSVVIGCASAPPAPEPVCRANRSADAPAEVLPEEWASLLLHGYDPRTNQVNGAPLDCTGTPIAWSEVDDDCAARVEAVPTPRTRRGPPTSVVAQIGETERLVWIPLLQTAGGEGLGPVGRVVQQRNALLVLAVGTGRAAPDRSSIRLERVNAVDVVLLEGERCEGSTCQRSTRLIPQRGRRFIAEPFTTLTGTCGGPALVWGHRQMERPVGESLFRIFELESTVAPSPNQLSVHEQLFIREREGRGATASTRLSRSAQDDRAITLDAHRIIVDKPSLWSRLNEFIAAL